MCQGWYVSWNIHLIIIQAVLLLLLQRIFEIFLIMVSEIIMKIKLIYCFSTPTSHPFCLQMPLRSANWQISFSSQIWAPILAPIISHLDPTGQSTSIFLASSLASWHILQVCLLQFHILVRAECVRQRNETAIILGIIFSFFLSSFLLNLQERVIIG